MLGVDGEYAEGYVGNKTYYKGNIIEVDSYFWNKNNDNMWTMRELNTINLNNNYLLNIKEIWNNKISTSLWVIGGNTTDNIYNVSAKTTYQNEIINPVENTVFTAKIGLLYASDYGFAVSPNYWTTELYNYNENSLKNNNWMYMGLNEWIITPCTDNNFVFYLSDNGRMFYYFSLIGHHSVRPTFYLNSDISYVSGSGTSSDPFRIN